MTKTLKRVIFLLFIITLLPNFIFASSKINIIADSVFSKTKETSYERIQLAEVIPENGPFGKIQKIKVGFFPRNYNSEIKVKNNTNIKVTYDKNKPREVVFVPFIGKIENTLDNLDLIKKEYYYGETVDLPSEEELGISGFAEIRTNYVHVIPGYDLQDALFKSYDTVKLNNTNIEDIVSSVTYSNYDYYFFSPYNDILYLFIKVKPGPITVCYDMSECGEDNRELSKAYGDCLNLEYPFQGTIPEGKIFTGYEIYDSSNHLINSDTPILRVYDNYVIKPIFEDKTVKNNQKDLVLFASDYYGQNIILELGLMTGKLFSINSLTGQLEKEYCKSYTVSDDFKTWYFNISYPILDGNGEKLDLKKVVQNWHNKLADRKNYDVYKLIKGTVPSGIPNSNKYWTNGFIDDFGVELIGLNTIKITTTESCPFVPYLLTMNEFGLNYRSVLSCTGPIYYDEDSNTYKKNQNYCRASEFNCDSLSKWELDSNYQTESLVDEFRNTNLIIFDKSDYKHEQNLTVNPFSDIFTFMVLSPTSEIFSDSEVTKNLSYAFQNYMNDTLFELSRNLSDIKRLYGFFPDCIGYSNSMKDTKDVDYSFLDSIDSLNVVIKDYYYYPIMNTLQETFLSFLDSIGIDYNEITFEDANNGKPWDVYCNGITFGQNIWTEERHLIPFVDLWAFENLQSYNNIVPFSEEISEKQQLVLHTEDFEKRVELYKQIDELLFEQVPNIIPCYTNQKESGWFSNKVSGAIVPFAWPYIYSYANLTLE